MRIAINILAAAISSVLVIGCSNNDGTPPLSATPSTVSGSAAKGIIQEGIVNAYPLGTAGVETRTVVGTARTLADGTYSLSMNDDYDEESALLLELTADAATKMTCDALSGCGSVARGDLLSLPSTFKLKTIIPAVGTDEVVKAQITAFTHIAAKSIQDSGDSSASNIAATTSKVNGLVGVNILETAPVDITDNSALNATGVSANQQRYAVMLAAIAEQAFKDDSGATPDVDDMIANLEAFAEDFKDGNFGSAGGLDMIDFLTAVDAEVANPANTLLDTAETALTGYTEVIAEGLNDDGEYAPAAASGESQTDVELAKALVTEVRTWNNSLAGLESPADAFADDAQIIIDTLDQDSQAVIEVFAEAMSVATSAIDQAIKSDEPTPTSVAVSNNAGSPIGNVTISNASGSDNQEFTITAADLNGVSIDSTVKLSISLSEANVAAGDVVLNVTGTAANADTRVTLDNVTFTITLAGAFSLEDDSDEPFFSGMALKGGIKLEELSSGAVTGKSVMGMAEIRMVRLADGLQSISDDKNFSLEKVALTDLTVASAAGSSAGLSISLEMDNATNFDTFGYLNGESEIQLYKRLSTDGFNIDQVLSDFSLSTLQSFSYDRFQDQTCASGFSSSSVFVPNSCQGGDIGNVKSQIEATLNLEYPQSYTSVELRYVSYSTFSFDNKAEVFAAVVVDDIETATSFLDATLNITGKLNLASHPEAVLSLTADKTGLKAGTFTATLGYDNKTMQLVANIAEGNSADTASGDLSFTNADGVAMKLNAISGNATTGVVTVDDVTVGTIEETSGGTVLIRYNDGSFESL